MAAKPPIRASEKEPKERSEMERTFQIGIGGLANSFHYDTGVH